MELEAAPVSDAARVLLSLAVSMFKIYILSSFNGVIFFFSQRTLVVLLMYAFNSNETQCVHKFTMYLINLL